LCLSLFLVEWLRQARISFIFQTEFVKQPGNQLAVNLLENCKISAFVWDERAGHSKIGRLCPICATICPLRHQKVMSNKR
jgi:hypothetical protein